MTQYHHSTRVERETVTQYQHSIHVEWNDLYTWFSSYAETLPFRGGTICDSVLVRKHPIILLMSRLTITLSDERYRALKEAAAQRGRTIGQLIDESLEFYGIKSREEAMDIVHRARNHAGLEEEDAMSAALDEVKRVRAGK